MTKAARDKDRALANAGPTGVSAEADVEMDEDAALEDGLGSETFGSKTIVIHPGSQNLRIGLATDALPKTVPMVIARKAAMSESEENGGEPRPKRLKSEDGTPVTPEEAWFGEEVHRVPQSLIKCMIDQSAVRRRVHCHGRRL